MRTLMMAAAIASLASAADAQRVSQRGPAMARPMARPAPHVMARPAGGGHYGHPAPKPPKPAPGGWQRPGHGWQGGHNGGWNRPGVVRPDWVGHGVRPPRWGNRVQGRWWAGWRAPGGWGAYRRPVRGWVLPSFWISPSWYINDWASYGLGVPPAGYTWSRYYDDAVLVDGQGSVYDSVSGVDWNGGYDDGDAYGDEGAYDQGAYDQGGYHEGGYDGGAYAAPGAPYAQPQAYYERPDNGVGGAAIGAVVGGVAGNAIAGRGNRLGGTLIGAGVGAVAGYAIDKAEDRGSYAAPGAGYPPPMPAYATRAPSPGYASPAPRVVQSGGYYANGYYYPGATVTTVTVTSAPVVTTTTEVFEDTVTYTRPVAHRAVRKWRAKPKAKCVCG